MESLPTNFHLEASRQIEPLQQGSMDNLCGLYAIVNALRLLRPPSARHDRRLFEAGVSYLDNREWLSAVMIEGMPTRLFATLAANLGNVEGRAVQRMASSRKGDMLEDAIMRAIVAGSPVVVSIDPPVDHYSVLCGYSPSRWLLFDSFGGRWLKRSPGLYFGSKVRLKAWTFAAPITPRLDRAGSPTSATDQPISYD